ncbi:MAG TPA: nucleotide exchange factor GrpE [Rectinema sp.]|jgi:molecular chaperone GrpE|nr:nucleotide exchange factor GrpE [Spirochaetia bacterium]HAL94153.1 nucleotide exchange factor GrpE [Spirochaetaceae bacterium]HNV19841.1 nucleotide exchange factor GrpE [Rectinema sp.]HNY99256.1 nucleotide exchange factor GrpE [Rectinema sp.]HOE76170.1 nucleotide exchange factor GrpE [Rectinema sp.]
MSKHKHEEEQQSEMRNQENSQAQNPKNSPSAPESKIEHEAEPKQVDQSATDLESQLAAANAEIERLKAQLEELNDKYLRTLAEQVNFRKRVVKEKEEFQQYAVSTLLNDLIPVLDDFDRSLDAVAQNHKDVEKVIEGIRLIQRRLYDTLSKKYGLKQYKAEGTAFDPHLHEAMFSEKGDVHEPKVTQEFLPGYKLHDRVIRTAKVKVMMPDNPAGAPSKTTEARGETQDSASFEGAGENSSLG